MSTESSKAFDAKALHLTVGEVFVRNAGGVWRATEETSMCDAAGGPFVIELSSGGPARYVNPVDKVFKRLENGPEDDLPYFFRLFAMAVSPSETE